MIRVPGLQDVVNEMGDSSILPFQLVHIELLEMVAKRCLTGHMLQKHGDRVNRLVHRDHADQRLKQVGLGESPLDWNGQMLVQCRDGMSATSFRFEVATLFAGSLPFC